MEEEHLDRETLEQRIRKAKKRTAACVITAIFCSLASVGCFAKSETVRKGIDTAVISKLVNAKRERDDFTRYLNEPISKVYAGGRERDITPSVFLQEHDSLLEKYRFCQTERDSLNRIVDSLSKITKGNTKLPSETSFQYNFFVMSGFLYFLGGAYLFSILAAGHNQDRKYWEFRLKEVQS